MAHTHTIENVPAIDGYSGRNTDVIKTYAIRSRCPLKTLSLAVVLLFAPILAADTSADLDAIAKAAYPANAPGAAVLVMKDGAALLRKGYGVADIELQVPISPDMIFRIGSVTKQFTAAAILLLEEEGKLSVGDDIRKYLPDYPTEGRTIRIEHLLTHTSGIRSYTDMSTFGDLMREDMAVSKLIDTFKNEPLAFAPGEKFAYNNSGYVLLGAIIEKASGKPYATFLRERIFGPLGMEHTAYEDSSKLLPGRAKGYDGAGTSGSFVNAAYLSMTLPFSAGSLASTVDDLAKWDQALYSNRLLSEASLEKWWKPFRLSDGRSTGYGYGWGIYSYQGHPVVGHGGGINGFTCQVLRLPSDRVYVAVLTNRNDESSDPGRVARELAAAAIGKPVVDPQPVSMTPQTLESFRGLYRIDDAARYLVDVEEGKLRLRRFGDEHPEGGRTRNPGPNERLNRVTSLLLPSSQSAFLVEKTMTTVRFEKSGSGDVRALVVEDWGREERAEKTGEPYDDRSRALAAVQKLFDGMLNGDGEAMRSVLDPDARLVQTAFRDGRPSSRSTTVKDFVSRIAGRTGPALLEKTGTPQVAIADNLASVFVPYTFFVGTELSHCGEDAFQLARTDIGWPGFKIIAIADTYRTEGCAPVPP
jgi:CubicO group peptidase (beta-lactamase class C family)